MIDRRALLLAAGAGVAAPSLARASRRTAYDFSFPGLIGGRIDLGAYRGRVLVVANTACQCGFTPQLGGLQQLYIRYRARGLMVVGVPSDDFGGQELDTAEEIAAFVQDQYSVGFPLTAKQNVVGENAHPFFQWAARERPAETPRWNFHKYLIGRDGLIAGVFPTNVPPGDIRMTMAVERAIAVA